MRRHGYVRSIQTLCTRRGGILMRVKEAKPSLKPFFQFTSRLGRHILATQTTLGSAAANTYHVPHTIITEYWQLIQSRLPCTYLFKAYILYLTKGLLKHVYALISMKRNTSQFLGVLHSFFFFFFFLLLLLLLLLYLHISLDILLLPHHSLYAMD